MTKIHEGSTLMSKYLTLLEQFRSFCFQNNATDLEEAIEYFAVFGGMGWNVDLTRPIEELIETKVFKNYRYIHGDIAKITQSNRNYHAVMSAFALGDGREYSAFKRAGVSREEGEDSVRFLIENGLLRREKSQEQPVDENEEVADKLLFTLPFMRFWFSAVSPYYKGIRDGDYGEALLHWEKMRQVFLEPVYLQLVTALVRKSFSEDPIERIGSYWDKNGEIDILARTRSGRIIAGACRYAKSKTKKSDLTKLKEQCARAELNPDIYVLFSKNGFSSELKKEKGAELRLFAPKNLRSLVEGLSKSDLLVNTNKKY